MNDRQIQVLKSLLSIYFKELVESQNHLNKQLSLFNEMFLDDENARTIFNEYI